MTTTFNPNSPANVAGMQGQVNAIAIPASQVSAEGWTIMHNELMQLFIGVGIMYVLGIVAGKSDQAGKLVLWILIALWVLFGLNYVQNKVLSSSAPATSSTSSTSNTSAAP